MFNFSEEDKGTKNVPIFNNGESGVANNVTITALKKGNDYEDGVRVPDYKIRFKDASGHIDTAFYYLTQESHNPQYGSYDDAVKKQWKKVGSVLDACGVNSSGQFANEKEMLDTLMSKINTATAGKTFNVFANYGHVNSPKKWLQIRSWVPFVELTGNNPTILKATKIDQLERLVPDSDNTTSTDGGWSA